MKTYSRHDGISVFAAIALAAITCAQYAGGFQGPPVSHSLRGPEGLSFEHPQDDALGCTALSAEAIVDPPPGGPLVDLPTLSDSDPDPDVVDVAIDVRMAPVNVNGVMANLFTYNGASPAPVIRAKRGDMLRIHFSNSLPATTETNLLGFTKNITNLHVHGLHVTPMDPGDNAALAISPGQSHNYEYDLCTQEPGGLNFYHTHAHGLVAEQYWGGLVGPIVIEDPNTDLASFETHILVLKDITLSGNAPAPHSMMSHYMQGMEGSTVMVNGQVNPVVSVRPGQVLRWRVLNASNARFYKLALEGHSLQVIGVDGGLLDRPYPQSYVLLSPGERVDLLVKAGSTPGNYRFLSLPYSRRGSTMSDQITLMTMACGGSPSSDTVPAVIDPGAQRLSIDTTNLIHRTYELGMMMGRATINGMDFDMMPDHTDSMLGDYEVWTVTNPGGMMGMSMDHPWHQHVNSAQVIGISGGDAAYSSFLTSAPAMKDVTLVPRGGSVTLLVPVMDWPGMTMYHCHILEHEDIGMMGMWDIMGMMPGEVADLSFCTGSKDCMTWSACTNATSYTLYEGGLSDLPALLTMEMDSCARWTGAGLVTGNELVQTPPSGSFIWYLAVGQKGMLQGVAGDATSGPRMLNSMGPCAP